MRHVTNARGETFAVNAADIGDWADVTHHEDHRHGHYYAARDKKNPARPVGVLRYLQDFPEEGIITLHELTVAEPYRNRGVGVALLAALHADHPDHKISPGHASDDLLPFIRHIMESEPEVEPFGHLLPSVRERL